MFEQGPCPVGSLYVRSLKTAADKGSILVTKNRTACLSV